MHVNLLIGEPGMRRVNSVRVVGVCAVLAAVSSVLGSVVGGPVTQLPIEVPTPAFFCPIG